MSHTERAKYPTDLTDEQWQILRKLLPQPSRRGAPQTICRRAVLNAILYVLRSGCAWRLLPHEFPKWKTVYGIFLALAQRRNLAEDSRLAPGQAPASRRAQEVAQRGDHRQSDRQDDRGRRPAGLRRRQEDQWPQAPHRCRHAGADPGGRGPSGKRSGLRRSGPGLGDSRPAEKAIPPAEGDLRRQRLRPKQPARVRERRLRVVAANRAQTSKGQRVCGAAEALDRGADLRLAGAISAAQQGLHQKVAVSG